MAGKARSYQHAGTDVFLSAGGGNVHHGVLERLFAWIPGRHQRDRRRILRKGTRRFPRPTPPPSFFHLPSFIRPRRRTQDPAVPFKRTSPKNDCPRSCSARRSHGPQRCPSASRGKSKRWRWQRGQDGKSLSSSTSLGAFSSSVRRCSFPGCRGTTACGSGS